MNNGSLSKEPLSKGRGMAPRRDLETVMGECLTDLQIQFSRHTMTTEEWDQKRKLWVDIVEGIIPPDRLAEVFKQAIRLHTDSFPLAVSELIPAWNLMKSEEWEQQRQIQLAHRSCETCVEAKKQNIPCPHHQRDYRITP